MKWDTVQSWALCVRVFSVFVLDRSLEDKISRWPGRGRLGQAGDGQIRRASPEEGGQPIGRRRRYSWALRMAGLGKRGTMLW